MYANRECGMLPHDQPEHEFRHARASLSSSLRSEQRAKAEAAVHATHVAFEGTHSGASADCGHLVPGSAAQDCCAHEASEHACMAMMPGPQAAVRSWHPF